MVKDSNEPLQLDAQGFALKDSGTRETFATGAVRDAQQGKGRFDLLPYHAIERVAQVFERGARKYADRNWEQGIPTHRFMDSGLRHALKYLGGWRDEDHLAQAAWNFLCLIETEHRVRTLCTLPRELLTLPEPAEQAELDMIQALLEEVEEDIEAEG